MVRHSTINPCHGCLSLGLTEDKSFQWYPPVIAHWRREATHKCHRGWQSSGLVRNHQDRHSNSISRTVTQHWNIHCAKKHIPFSILNISLPVSSLVPTSHTGGDTRLLGMQSCCKSVMCLTLANNRSPRLPSLVFSISFSYFLDS